MPRSELQHRQTRGHRQLSNTQSSCPTAVFMQELSGDIANFGSQKEQRTKAAQGKLKAAKAGLEASKKAAKEAGQTLTQAAAEAEAATNERQSLTEQLQGAQKAVQGIT